MSAVPRDISRAVWRIRCRGLQRGRGGRLPPALVRRPGHLGAPRRGVPQQGGLAGLGRVQHVGAGAAQRGRHRGLLLLRQPQQRPPQRRGGRVGVGSALGAVQGHRPAARLPQRRQCGRSYRKHETMILIAKIRHCVLDQFAENVLGTRGAVLHHSAETVLCFRNQIFFFFSSSVSAVGKVDLPMV